MTGSHQLRPIKWAPGAVVVIIAISFTTFSIESRSAGPSIFLSAAATQSPATDTIPAQTPTGDVRVKVLAINDLHGRLSQTDQLNGRPVGGAAVLGAHVKARAASAEHPFIVSAGDLYGASAPESALLDEEPTIAAAEAMGVVISTPGNHELDRGIDRYVRITGGGCDETRCFSPRRIRQISSNILVRQTGQPLLDPYHIEIVDGVPIAFIGAVHTNLSVLTTRDALDDLWFLDPAQAVNRYVDDLRAQGVKAFVVMIHEGGHLDARGELVGPITSFADRLRPEIQVVASAHTHQWYAVKRGGRLITQGFADGVGFVDIDLTLDRTTGEIVEANAELVPTFGDVVDPDPEVQRIVERAEALTRPRTEPVVGTAVREITKVQQTEAGDTPLGALVADAQRWAVGADVGVTNLFNIRDSIHPGPVTWRDLFLVHPFANQLVTVTLSGEQLYTLFNEQWSNEDGVEEYRPLQVSGISVVWDGRRPRGDRIVALRLPNGRAIERAASYRVVVNDFLADGGDGCSVLRSSGERAYGPVEADALAGYIATLRQPFATSSGARITRLG